MNDDQAPRVWTMNDRDLAVFLGLGDAPNWRKCIEVLAPEKRAVFERMAQVTIALQLWEAGLGPKPSGVIVCKA